MEHHDSKPRPLEVLVRVLMIVGYTFLYIGASFLASGIGILVSHSFERLLLRSTWRGVCDWESTIQSMCILLSVMIFLVASLCLFAMSLLDATKLSILEQIGISLFGITVFAIALSLSCVVLMVLRLLFASLRQRTLRWQNPDERTPILGKRVRKDDDDDEDDDDEDDGGDNDGLDDEIYDYHDAELASRNTSVEDVLPRRQAISYGPQPSEPGTELNGLKQTWIKMDELSSVRNLEAASTKQMPRPR